MGPRGVYDEVKRFAEAMTIAYHHARDPGQDHPIFNSYGPRMRRADERAVPNFIEQALTGKPLAMHGDGMQTRSLCYVDDLIEGIWRYWNAEFFGVMNICNPHEVTVLELAKTIVELTHSNSELTFEQRPVEDRRCAAPTSRWHKRSSAGNLELV